MNVQAKLAKTLGIKYTIVPNNGYLIEFLKKTPPKLTNIIDVDKLALDGKELISIRSKHLKEREYLKESGLISITILINKYLHLIYKPKISYFGLISKEHLPRIQNILLISVKDTLFKVYLKPTHNIDFIEQFIKNNLNHCITNILKKNPYKIIHIISLKNLSL